MKLNRELIAQAVVILAVCVGGWLMFVQPRMEEINRLESIIAQHQLEPEHAAQLGGLDQATVEYIAAEASALRERVRHIEQANALGHDSSHLYAVMMDLARQNGVFVHTLHPGSAGRTTGPASQPVTGMQVRQISMSVQGTFEQIASFLDSLNTVPGFFRPASLMLMPQADDQGHVAIVANLSLEVLSFIVPDALLAMKGGPHAKH
ncbi:MAG TPA: hypothetical protein PK400_03015 [Phycisphaerales bacterium]|nr:hypothetical protein [Phycisphaerales bacterium]HRQ75207.1 hypothetical protein [Phycisphaerales bacterium]